MMYKWICSTDVLVDDCVHTFNVEAENTEDAWCKAYTIVQNSNVLDSCSLEMHMCPKDLAYAIQRIVDGTDDVPEYFIKDIESIANKPYLYSTLEMLVCENKEEQ